MFIDSERAGWELGRARVVFFVFRAIKKTKRALEGRWQQQPGYGKGWEESRCCYFVWAYCKQKQVFEEPSKKNPDPDRTAEVRSVGNTDLSA